MTASCQLRDFRSTRRLRVTHCPVNVAGIPWENVQALRRKGSTHGSSSSTAGKLHPEADWSLDRRGPLPLRLAQQSAAFARLLPKTDVFHFYFGLTLVPKSLQFPLLRAPRRKSVFHYLGSDIRGKTPRGARLRQARRRRDRRLLRRASAGCPTRTSSRRARPRRVHAAPAVRQPAAARRPRALEPREEGHPPRDRGVRAAARRAGDRRGRPARRGARPLPARRHRRRPAERRLARRLRARGDGARQAGRHATSSRTSSSEAPRASASASRSCRRRRRRSSTRSARWSNSPRSAARSAPRAAPTSSRCTTSTGSPTAWSTSTVHSEPSDEPRLPVAAPGAPLSDLRPRRARLARPRDDPAPALHALPAPATRTAASRSSRPRRRCSRSCCRWGSRPRSSASTSTRRSRPRSSRSFAPRSGSRWRWRRSGSCSASCSRADRALDRARRRPMARSRRRSRALGADELPAAHEPLPRRGALDRIRDRERDERRSSRSRRWSCSSPSSTGARSASSSATSPGPSSSTSHSSRTAPSSSASSSTGRSPRRCSRFGMPLVPSALALWAINFVDREFLVWYRTSGGRRLLGAVKIASVITFVMIAFRTAWPAFAYSIEDDREAKRTYAFVLTYLLAFASLARARARRARAVVDATRCTASEYRARREGRRAARVRRRGLRGLHGARDRQRPRAQDAAELGRHRRRQRQPTSGSTSG